MSRPLSIVVFEQRGALDLGVLTQRFQVHAFQRAEDALAGMNHLSPIAMLADLTDEGIDLVERAVVRDPGMPMLMIARGGEVQDPGRILAAMRAGARDVVDIGEKDGLEMLERRLDAAIAWIKSMNKDREVRLAALRAIAERSQIDLVTLEGELYDNKAKLEAEAELLTQAQRQLEEQRAIGMAASHAKSRFLANISHELNAPLNAIVNYGEMLAEDLDKPEQIEDVQRIIVASKRLRSMVGEVFNLARLESGQVHPVYEAVPIDALLERCVEQVRTAATRTHVSVEVRPSDVAEVVTDPLRLVEALSAILQNAVKFSPGGKVSIEVEEREGSVVFSVIDNGVGLPTGDLTGLFDAFAVATTGATREFGGAGLGLAIASQVTRVLGGTLTGRRLDLGGSRFEISIPVAQTGSLLAMGRGEATVLVVDDDPVVRKVLERMLVADGFTVVTTGNPEEVVELARQHRPVFAILDVRLPGTDGWTLLEDLVRDRAVGAMPIAMMSAADESERALEEGACAFLDKPIQRQSLREALREHAEEPCSVVVIGATLPPSLVDLEHPGVRIRPVRAAELLDVLSRDSVVVLSTDLDADEALSALRQLDGRPEVSKVVLYDQLPKAELAYLKRQFGNVVRADALIETVRTISRRAAD